MGKGYRSKGLDQEISQEKIGSDYMTEEEEFAPIHEYCNALEDTLEVEAEQITNPDIKRGLSWLLDRALNKHGGFGLAKGEPSIIQLTADALLALGKGGYRHDDPMIKKILQYLKGTQNANGSWPIESGNERESVGVTGMIVQSFNALELDRSNPMILKAMGFLLNSFSMEKGCWRENVHSLTYGEISINEAASSALKDAMLPNHRQKLRVVLEDYKNPDFGYGWNIHVNHSDVENTAFALKIMANVEISKDSTIAQNAIKYLLGSQVKNGGFPIKKGQNPENDPTAIVVSALLAIGVEPFNESIRNAIKYLINSQNTDGGWGDLKGKSSDTDSTALAVTAIIEAGMAAVPLVNIRDKLGKTKEFLIKYIQKREDEKATVLSEVKSELQGSKRLNRILELVVTVLSILLSIFVTFAVI